MELLAVLSTMISVSSKFLASYWRMSPDRNGAQIAASDHFDDNLVPVNVDFHYNVSSTLLN